jgi:hypothetical protein
MVVMVGICQVTWDKVEFSGAPTQIEALAGEVPSLYIVVALLVSVGSGPSE